MKKSLLKEGDVIYLENGMKVYSDVPEKFVYYNKKKSNKKTHTEIIVGEVLENDTDVSRDIDNLIVDVIQAFDFRLGIGLTKAEASILVKSKISATNKVKFCLDGGEFLVVKTHFEGGGTAMFNDVYPDGHHVFCKKLDANGKYDENSVEVDFYQSGSFTAMISANDITIVRTLTPKFV